MKLTKQGFTLIELLIVLTVITSTMGLLFPLGSHLNKKSLHLSVQADTIRYQNTFLDYFEAFEDYPEGFPVDQWFNLNEKFSQFVNFFKTKNQLKFSHFTAQEVKEEKYLQPAKLYFFLCKNKDIADALEISPNTTIQGTQVLYTIEFE